MKKRAKMREQIMYLFNGHFRKFNDIKDVNLICFPYAGGAAASYFTWSDWLENNVNLIAVQPPGRANRLFETPFDDMDLLVNNLLDDIAPYLERDVIFFGHSLGSRVAFACMVELANRNAKLPIAFIASGSLSPDTYINDKMIHALPDEEFLEEVVALGGTDAETSESKELMKLCLPALKADFKIAETHLYQGQLSFSCPLYVIGGNEDDSVPIDKLEGWKRHFSGEHHIQLVDGDHFFINNSDLIREPILKVFNECVGLESTAS